MRPVKIKWVKWMLPDENSAPDWTAIWFACAAAVVCMFVLFATCEKGEPKPGRTQVGSHTIVDVKSVLEFEARELEKGK